MHSAILLRKKYGPQTIILTINLIMVLMQKETLTNVSTAISKRDSVQIVILNEILTNVMCTTWAIATAMAWMLK